MYMCAGWGEYGRKVNSYLVNFMGNTGSLGFKFLCQFLKLQFLEKAQKAAINQIYTGAKIREPYSQTAVPGKSTKGSN